MADVHIKAGTLTASFEDRTISGLLLPYGEVGNTNLGKFSVARGTVTIPADASVVTLNKDHSREDPIGRSVILTDTDEGVVGTFTVARTPEGDAALKDADAVTGTRRMLSAEVKNIVLRAGALVSGTLFGAAQVAVGAFPSASLYAADVGDASEPLVTIEESTEAFTTPDGRTASKTTTVTTTVDGGRTTIDTVETIDEPAEEVIDPTLTPEEGAPAVAKAIAPNTLTAQSKPAAPAGPSFLEMTQNLGRAKATGDRALYAAIAGEAAAAESLFAALSDVTAAGAGAAINQIPQWLGELWNGRAFTRRIIPLIGSGPLTAMKIAGWRWLVEPEVAEWAGFPAAVSSNVPTTEAYEVTARRFAGAHSVAREYRDFDVPGFWDGYFRGMTQSYDRQADAACLLDLLAAATPVVAGAVPAGVSSGMASVVDGALSILDRGIPSFAVVAKDVYRDILLTRNDDTLTYLNTSLGLEEGTIESFRVVPHGNMTAGAVLVGAKEAATSHELAGVPIRVEGLDMVRGGIDPGVFGYAGNVIHDASALSLVTQPI